MRQTFSGWVAILALCLVGCEGDDIGGPSAYNLRISIVPSGVDLGSGYRAYADTKLIGTVSPDLPLLVFLVPCAYTVALAGLPANCVVVGAQKVPTEVSFDRVVEVRFRVTCTATTATLEVRVPTAGGDFDVDGYRISVDGTTGGFYDDDVQLSGVVQPNQSILFRDLPAADYEVTISDLALNCTLNSSNHWTLSLETGGLTRDVGRITFEVSCTATTGSIRVTTTTTPPQPNTFFGLELDGEPVMIAGYSGYDVPMSVAAQGEALIERVPPGNHTVSLVMFATCSVTGPYPRPVSVTVGETSNVALDIDC